MPSAGTRSSRGLSFLVACAGCGSATSQIEVVRLATERRACSYRNHDAEDQRNALPADFGRGVEMAAGAQRSEANDNDFIFLLMHEGMVNDTLQHWAEGCRNNQTHLISRRKTFNFFFLAENK